MTHTTRALSTLFLTVSALGAQSPGPEAIQVATDLGLLSPVSERAPHQAGTPSPMGSEELFFKFDERGGARAINFAPVAAPREGQIVSTLPLAWVGGRFNAALAAGSITPTANSNRVETGWAPGQITGSDFTWAAFLRVGNNHPAPSLSYVFGIPTALEFRVFTGANSIITSSWMPSAPALRTVANVYALASANWVHVALTIDTNRSSATYYIDGVAEPPIAISGGFTSNVTALNVGQQLPTLGASIYAIDDFRLLTRAATPLEIASWAAASTAVDASYGQGCGADLRSLNGPPTLGNGTYQLAVSSTTSTVGVIGLGGARHDLGGFPLPLDLGLFFPTLAGCHWETSAEVFLPVVLSGGGGIMPLVIPNSLALRHRSLYAQALVFAGTTPESSNPFVISMEP